MFLIGVSATGSDHHRRTGPRPVVDAQTVSSPIVQDIISLRNSPKEDDREDAAEDLRKFDWRRHPEVVQALSDALSLDPSDDVREEAAESLGKMRPFVPIVHESLLRASTIDPDRGVRKEARKALGSLGRRCIVDCPICGPLPTGSVIQGPTIIPPAWMPWLVPDSSDRNRSETTPSDEPLPPALPDPSTLSDEPPPPPTPIRLEGPFGGNPRPSRLSTVRVR
ncbi:HEAT repeat domain-containing protein [Tundrisphaera lichenicola]|uniref:HEAT repeat domain-containing protein n=1 Tax=Tundrisphaera lichenicola TaxID=2029860 RepID=UPI003EB6C1A5